MAGASVDPHSILQSVRAGCNPQFPKAVESLQGLNHSGGNIQKADPAVKEASDGDLIGSIGRRRCAFTANQGLARHSQARESDLVGLLKCEFADRGKV